MEEQKNNKLTTQQKIWIGVGVVAGFSLGILIGTRIKIVNAPVINIPINNANINSGMGYARKLVEDLDSGVIYRSVKEAAKAAGVSATTMSNHLNGRSDHIDGKVYEIVGLGTQ